jgi:putative ABC transport system permease protein
MWGIALKRLWHHPWLTVLSVVGITLTIGLMSSISIFARAVSFVMLKEELAELSARAERPLFSLRVYVYPTGIPLSLEQCDTLGEHVAQTLASEIDLPLLTYSQHIESAGLILRTTDQETPYGAPHTMIAKSLNLAVVPDVASRLTMVEGISPPSTMASNPSRDGLLDVWMHHTLLDEMGITPGETFELRNLRLGATVPIRIAGAWRATVPNDPLWFGNPDKALREKLFVRKRDYQSIVEPLFQTKLGFAAWTLVLDDSALAPERMHDYADGLDQALKVIAQYVPDAQADSLPTAALNRAIDRETRLTALLFVFSMPLTGFLLYFMALLSTMTVYWQRRETALMVSRGMRVHQLLGVGLVEIAVLVGVSLPLGIVVGAQFARLMGNTKSFLSFTWREPLPVSPKTYDASLLIAAVALTLITWLRPVLRSARTSIVAHERVRSRTTQKPFWQRFYLDVLLLIPLSYAYRQLSLQGTLVPRLPGEYVAAEEDPLMLLVPALFVLTISLLAIRLFPYLMRLGDSLGLLARRPPFYLAFRQLTRQSSSYTHPLLLIITALSLGTFMASMAYSLDGWLTDQEYYAIGSDILIKTVIRPGDDVRLQHHEAVLSGQAAAEEASFQRSALSLPIETYRDAPGVVWAARVGMYPATIPIGSTGTVQGTFIGLDRVDTPSVLFYRPDFGTASLGEMMNLLASRGDGILVSQRTLEKGQYQVGDTLQVYVSVNGVPLDAIFHIVGTYRYFPTVYDKVGKEVEKVRQSAWRRRTPYSPPVYMEVDGPPAVVGNLDHVFGQIGATMAHGIWLKLTPDADRQAIFDQIESRGVQVSEYQDARAEIAGAQARVERVGVFGTLTIGFIAATVLSGIGLLIYSYASLQERLFRFTILRAVGLSQQQVVTTVMIEYLVLLLYSVVGGVALGALASRLFIPFFQAADKGVLNPPTLVPQIAWHEVGWISGAFATVLVVAQGAVIGAALRRGVFQALRLGDRE